MVNLFKVLRALKGLRGAALDIIGYSEERMLERRLIVEYAAPMRDYGHIKRRHLAEVLPKQAEMLAALDVARPEVVAEE